MTYKQKRDELLAHLEARGWRIERRSSIAPWKDLKVPRATSPDRRAVLSFRTQAIYMGEHSLVSDSKSVSGERLIALALS